MGVSVYWPLSKDDVSVLIYTTTYSNNETVSQWIWTIKIDNMNSKIFSIEKKICKGQKSHLHAMECNGNHINSWLWGNPKTIALDQGTAYFDYPLGWRKGFVEVFFDIILSFYKFVMFEFSNSQIQIPLQTAGHQTLSSRKCQLSGHTLYIYWTFCLSHFQGLIKFYRIILFESVQLLWNSLFLENNIHIIFVSSDK